MIRFPKRKAILPVALVLGAIVVVFLLINVESVQRKYAAIKNDTRAQDFAGWYEIEADKQKLLSPRVVIKVLERSGYGLMDTKTRRIRVDFLDFLAQWFTRTSETVK